MTLYHQDPVATLSQPSEGPSHSSWGTISVSHEQHKLHGIAIHCSIFPSSYHWDSETPIHLPREFTAQKLNKIILETGPTIPLHILHATGLNAV